MRKDFEANLRSPEASDVILRYYSTGQPSNPEEPYHSDGAPLLPDPIDLTIRSLQKIIGPSNVKGVHSTLFEIGDCIFYFSTSVNMEEPVSGMHVAEGTIQFIDPSGMEWSPKPIQNLDEKKLRTFHLGNLQYCQAVLCCPGR